MTPQPKEIPANIYSGSKIDLIGKFGIRLRNDYMRGNHFRKVIHNQFCENLLKNVISLFRVEIVKGNGILEFSKRSLNASSHTIKLFEFVRREITCVKIGNESLIKIIVNL